MAVLRRYETDGISFSHSVDEKPNDRSFPLHMHNNYEIYCFVSGKASYMVEGNLYALRQGTVIIMRRSETHKLIVNGSGRYERFSVNFYPEMLRELGVPDSLFAPFTQRTLGEKNIYRPEDIEHCRLLDMILKMYAECQTLPTKDALYINLCAMLSSIAAAFEHYPEDIAYSSKRDMDRELLNYINDNITKELSVEKISEYVHLSPTQLGRRFRELTGTTVYQYIISKRLILAQRQIAKGKSAALAAEDCGFGDYSGFYRMYKKKFGCSPMAERKTIQHI